MMSTLTTDTSMMKFAYGESSDTEIQISASDWRASSTANASSLAVARDLLPMASGGQPVAIPGTAHMNVDYSLHVRNFGDAMRCEIYRSDGLLISTFTVVKAGSDLTADDVVFDPPCCFVARAPGALLARDADAWLTRFEQAVAIAILGQVA